MDHRQVDRRHFAMPEITPFQPSGVGQGRVGSQEHLRRVYVIFDNCLEKPHHSGRNCLSGEIRLHHGAQPVTDDLFGGQALFQAQPGIMKTRLHRRHGNFQKGADRLLRVFANVEQGDDRSLWFRQCINRCQHFLRFFLRFPACRRRGAVNHQLVGGFQGDKVRLLSALVAVDLPLNHPPEPAGKGRRLAQLVQCAVGIEKRLLRYILGQAAIP